MSLSNQQKRHLRGLTHSLKPIILMGQHGMTDSLMSEINLALEKHELIKIKLVAGDKEDKKRLIEHIAKKSKAEVIQTIGHMASYFLRNPKKPKIAIPSK